MHVFAVIAKPNPFGDGVGVKPGILCASRKVLILLPTALR
jgi:hypothetical protein